MGIFGDILGAITGDKAAKAQKSANNRTLDLQEKIYYDQRDLAMPGYDRAEIAANTLQQLLGLQVPNTTSTRNTNFGDYVDLYPDLVDAYSSGQGMARGKSKAEFGEQHYNRYGRDEQRALPNVDQALQTQPIASQNELFEAFRNTPGYQFQVEEGLKAINRRAPLTGGLDSGRVDKARINYASNLADTTYNNYLNRIANVASGSPQAIGMVGQAGQNYAANTGNTLMRGTALTNNYNQNSAQSWGNILDGIGGIFAGGSY